jgi:DinB family protein
MNRLCLALFVCLCLIMIAQAATPELTPQDRESAFKYLESTRQGIVDATQGLSADQWNFKPAPDRWSIAEVMEHIAAAEDYLEGNVTANVMKAPPRKGDDDVKAIDEMVLKGVPDRSHKAQAPEPLKPTNRFGSPEGSLKHFLESRQRTEDFLKSTNDLRAHATDSPMGKQLDAYEWILFVAAHSDRHTKQILEVKADPNFPKS